MLHGEIPVMNHVLDIWTGLHSAVATRQTADPGIASSIPSPATSFVEIDHETFSTVFLPSTDLRRAGVSY